jgi:hypothetical protein
MLRKTMTTTRLSYNEDFISKFGRGNDDSVCSIASSPNSKIIHTSRVVTRKPFATEKKTNLLGET